MAVAMGAAILVLLLVVSGGWCGCNLPWHWKQWQHGTCKDTATYVCKAAVAWAPSYLPTRQDGTVQQLGTLGTEYMQTLPSSDGSNIY